VTGGCVTSAAPDRPRLAAHLRVEVLAADRAVLLGESGDTILRGRVYVELLPMLDGTRSVGEIMRCLDGIVSPAEVAYALGRAAAGGYVVDGPPCETLEPSQEAYWNALGVAGPRAAQWIAQRAVALSALGDAPAGALRRALVADGARLAADGELLVVATDDYLRAELAEINREALERGRPWLLARLTGPSAWIGPLFEPGRTGCWECLAQRLRANRQAERFLAEQRGRPGPFPTARAALPTTIDASAALVATQALRWIVTGSNEIVSGRVVTVEIGGAATNRHELVRRPQCSACGSAPAGAADGEAVALRPAPTSSTGGARGTTAAGLLERYGHHVSPITGVVSALQDRPSPDPTLGFTCTAVHDFPMYREDMDVLRHNLQGRSGGKGATRAEAAAGALGEAIERYSCVWRDEEERTLLASARELGERAVALATCLGFSARQIAEREKWNRGLRNPHHVVPMPLDPDLTISWTPLWSLTREEVRYLPSAYCYYGHPDMAHFVCLGDSNGCAAGSTLEEAIYHGLMELLERDAVAIWWYNRLRRAAVEVDPGALPWHDLLRARLAAEQRDLCVLDLTCDTQIPTYAAISARLEHPVEDIILGFAADLDANAAIMHALTELAQSHPQVARRSASGTTVYGTRDRETLDWLRSATRARDPYLVPDPGAPARRASDHPRAGHDDLRDDVAECVRRLDEHGLEILVLDQTRPDVGMPACRVVVPGLCHFWRRLGHARLYDVPVREGWLERPTAEADLNPSSVFF